MSDIEDGNNAEKSRNSQDVLIMANEYCIYLRKSRSDVDAEQRGEGETLARHEVALLELAKRQNLNVTQIYREVVSGETIAARPVMQKLLSEVEPGKWAGILVMEVERLARGDTIDQGIVAQAFRYSNTRIITPMKTYDPSNEFDEEYFEFGLFMSRREYKTINRRLQRGRLASASEGKYVANKAPYGYNRVKIQRDKGFTLEIDPDRAEVIRLIYDLFVNGEILENGDRRQAGTYLISRRLNKMKISSFTGRGWTQGSIRDILINPVYTGKIRWNWRKTVKTVVDGNRIATRPRQALADCQLFDGLHKPIISNEIWQRAQEIMSERAIPPTPEKRATQNPLSGLVICGKCGRRMSRRPDSRGKTPPSLICAATDCDNVSSYLHYIEEKTLALLAMWLQEYKIKMQITEESPAIQIDAKEKTIKSLEETLANTRKQLNNLHDLLEQGVYDKETFLSRSKALSDRNAETLELLENAKFDLQRERLREKSKIDIIPKVEQLLGIYNSLPTALHKNQLLKEILDKIVYVKETSGRWHGSPDDFTIILYPKIRDNESTK